MPITPEYEDFLAQVVVRYPGFFWQFNFFDLIGGAALGIPRVEALLLGGRAGR